MWRVVTPKMYVRLEPSPTAATRCIKEAGEILWGRQEGEWIALLEESGHMKISNLDPTLSRDGKPGVRVLLEKVDLSGTAEHFQEAALSSPAFARACKRAGFPGDARRLFRLVWPDAKITADGDYVCTSCGAVLEERCFDDSNEWRSFASEGIETGQQVGRERADKTGGLNEITGEYDSGAPDKTSLTK